MSGGSRNTIPSGNTRGMILRGRMCLPPGTRGREEGTPVPETLRRRLSDHLRERGQRIRLRRLPYLARGDLRAQLRQLIRWARALRKLSRERVNTRLSPRIRFFRRSEEHTSE